MYSELDFNVNDAVAWEGISKTEYGLVAEENGVKIVKDDAGHAFRLSDMFTSKSFRKLSVK